MAHTITVYADYVCPYCFLEIPALEALEDELGVTIDWRAFELRPDPVPTLEPRGEYLITTWRDSVYPLAAWLGIPIQLPPVQPRSRLAFEGAEFARDHGRFRAYNTAVYQAFFQHGQDIGDVDVLTMIAGQVGLDRGAFHAALVDRRYQPRVQEQTAAGRAHGVYGVPTMIIGQQQLFGSVPYATLRDAVAASRERGHESSA